MQVWLGQLVLKTIFYGKIEMKIERGLIFFTILIGNVLAHIDQFTCRFIKRYI